MRLTNIYAVIYSYPMNWGDEQKTVYFDNKSVDLCCLLSYNRRVRDTKPKRKGERKWN